MTYEQRRREFVERYVIVRATGHDFHPYFVKDALQAWEEIEEAVPLPDDSSDVRDSGAM